MERIFEGKCAVITGGSRGIGRACALKLASMGANIVISYAGNDEKAAETQKLCEQYGVKALSVKGDVADKNIADGIIKTAQDSFGSVDILINSAGITRDGLIMTMDDEAFDDVIDTNLKGSWQMMRAVSRVMMRQRSGRIINISSVVGLSGNAGQANYAASKGGVIALTKSLAKEIATRGVTVNAIAPGFIDTDMTKAMTESAREATLSAIPMKRMGIPEDIAGCAAFLAGPDASYITGQVISVDGGMHM